MAEKVNGVSEKKHYIVIDKNIVDSINSAGLSHFLVKVCDNLILKNGKIYYYQRMQEIKEIIDKYYEKLKENDNG